MRVCIAVGGPISNMLTAGLIFACFGAIFINDVLTARVRCEYMLCLYSAGVELWPVGAFQSVMLLSMH